MRRDRLTPILAESIRQVAPNDRLNVFEGIKPYRVNLLLMAIGQQLSFGEYQVGIFNRKSV